MSFDYSHPNTRVYFGRGRREEIGDLVSDYGEKVLLVTTPEAMQELGFHDDITSSLDESGLEYDVFTNVQPNPRLKDVHGCVEGAWDTGVDVIVGVGGGSVIDTAKTVAMALESFESTPTPGELWEFCKSDEEVTDAAPLVAVPSTSGTGTHMDPWAVVVNEEENAKVGFGGMPATVPKAAVVDPDLPGEMPRTLASHCGFDALCHLSEAYVSAEGNPLSDSSAREGLRLIEEYLVESVEGDPEAREKMTIADTLAGVCETTSTVIATHAVADGVCGLYPSVSHGEALGAIASQVAEFNVENGPKSVKRRYGIMAEILGQPVADPELDAKLAVEAIDEYKSHLGLKSSLGDLGVKENELEYLVDHAFEHGEIMIEANPTNVDRDELLEIVKSAY